MAGAGHVKHSTPQNIEIVFSRVLEKPRKLGIKKHQRFVGGTVFLRDTPQPISRAVGVFRPDGQTLANSTPGWYIACFAGKVMRGYIITTETIDTCLVGIPRKAPNILTGEMPLLKKADKMGHF